MSVTKTLLALSFLFLLFTCNQDDESGMGTGMEMEMEMEMEPEMPTTRDVSVSIQLPASYDIQTLAFLVDEPGEILSELELVPGTTNLLELTEIPFDNKVSLVLTSIRELSFDLIRTREFKDIPDQISINVPEEDDSDIDFTEIFIDNLDANFVDLTSHRFTSVTESAPNQIRINPSRLADDSHIFVSLRDERNNEHRFIWEEVFEDQPALELDFLELPFMSSSTINLAGPTEEEVLFQLVGFNDANGTSNIILNNDFEPITNTSIEIELPTFELDRYASFIRVNEESRTYSERRNDLSFDEISTPYEDANVEVIFEESENGISQFMTSGDYIFYSTTFTLEEAIPDLNYAYTISSPAEEEVTCQISRAVVERVSAFAPEIIFENLVNSSVGLNQLPNEFDYNVEVASFLGQEDTVNSWHRTLSFSRN